MTSKASAAIGLAINYAAILGNSILPAALLDAEDATSFVSLYSSMMFCGAISRLGGDRWLLKLLMSTEAQSSEKTAICTSLLTCICFSTSIGAILSTFLASDFIQRIALTVLPGVLVATSLLATVLRAKGFDFLPAISQGGLFSLFALLYVPIQKAYEGEIAAVWVLLAAAALSFTTIFTAALKQISELRGAKRFEWQFIKQQLGYTAVHVTTILINQADLVVLPWLISSEDFITYVLASRLAMATSVPLIVVNFVFARQLAGPRRESELALLSSSRWATVGWTGIVSLGIFATYFSPLVSTWWHDVSNREGFTSICLAMLLSQLANSLTGSISIWLQFQGKHNIVLTSQVAAILTQLLHGALCAYLQTYFTITIGFALMPMVWNSGCAVYQSREGNPVCDHASFGIATANATIMAFIFWQ